MDNKLIYEFSSHKADGEASLSNLLGGKGANLAEMSKLGIEVPPGFTITTEVCNYFSHNNHCLLYTSPSPRDVSSSRMPSSA